MISLKRTKIKTLSSNLMETLLGDGRITLVLFDKFTSKNGVFYHTNENTSKSVIPPKPGPS